MFCDEFEISFEEGNLLDFVGDGIVINTNIKLNLNYTLGKAVLSKSGTKLSDELDMVHRNQFSGNDVPLGTAVSTDSFGMAGSVNRLIFVVWWGDDNEYTTNHIMKVYSAAIREADKYNLKSIAVPLMGRGHRLSYSTIAEGIAQSIIQMNSISKRFSLEKISFVSHHKADVDSVQKLLENWLLAQLNVNITFVRD